LVENQYCICGNKAAVSTTRKIYPPHLLIHFPCLLIKKTTVDIPKKVAKIAALDFTMAREKKETIRKSMRNHRWFFLIPSAKRSAKTDIASIIMWPAKKFGFPNVEMGYFNLPKYCPIAIMEAIIPDKSQKYTHCFSILIFKAHTKIRKYSIYSSSCFAAPCPKGA